MLGLMQSPKAELFRVVTYIKLKLNLGKKYNFVAHTC